MIPVVSGQEAEIAACLRDAVLDRRLTPGTKLSEEELAAAFETTRARIRRVLLSLSQEKIVTLFPGRGAFIAAPSQTEAKEIIAARVLLEVGLLEQRREPVGDVPVELNDIITAEQDAVARGDRATMIRLSGAFHVALARWLGNAVIADILEQLILRTSLIIALYEPFNGACCLPSDHGALLEALRTQQTTQSAMLMNDHLRRMEARFDFTRRPDKRARLRDVLQAPMMHLTPASS